MPDQDRRQIAHQLPINTVKAQLTPERIAKIEQVASQRQRGLALLMEHVWDPHNLAAIMRTADTFGVQFIHYTARTPYDFEEIGANSSQYANKWVDVTYHGATTPVSQLQAAGWQVVVTVLSGVSRSLYEADWTTDQPLMVVVGNERNGISPETARAADLPIHIPMRGMVQSLNVSVAAALTLAEITRQRDASQRDFRLSAQDAATLTEKLLRRALY